MQFGISSGIITVCTMSSLFMYSNKTVVFTYFFLFSLSAIALSFLISTFFSRAKTAVAVGTLSFLGAFFPYYTVNDPSVPMLVLIPLHSLVVYLNLKILFFQKFLCTGCTMLWCAPLWGLALCRVGRWIAIACLGW